MKRTPPRVDPDLSRPLGTCAGCGAPSNTAFCGACAPAERENWYGLTDDGNGIYYGLGERRGQRRLHRFPGDQS